MAYVVHTLSVDEPARQLRVYSSYLSAYTHCMSILACMMQDQCTDYEISTTKETYGVILSYPYNDNPLLITEIEDE